MRRRPRQIKATLVLAAASVAWAAQDHDSLAAYVVNACGSSTANRSWSESRTAPATHLRTFTSCPAGTPDPYGSMYQGIGMSDILWGGEMPPGGELGGDGRFAEMRFVAPRGTRIRAASVNRDIGHRYSEWTHYGRIDGVDRPEESCQPGPYEIFCRRSGWITFSALNATTVAYGARCATSPGCQVGASLHRVWALILEARITLDDLEPPAVGEFEPIGLADGRWQNGPAELVFSATDNTGVQERRVVEGSTVRARQLAPGAAAGGCYGGTGDAFTYVDPCAGARGVNGRRVMTVDPCAWGPGGHEVRAVAFDVDRAQDESTAVTVNVDCAAPTISVDAGDATREEGQELTPAVRAADATSGLSATVLEVSVDGAGWQPAGSTITVVADRAYRFRARATDVAGNVSAWSYSATVRGVAQDRKSVV